MKYLFTLRSKPILNRILILQDVLYLGLYCIKTEKEPSASVNPVKNQGFNLDSTCVIVLPII